MNAATLETTPRPATDSEKRTRKRSLVRWVKRVGLGVFAATAAALLAYAWAPKPIAIEMATVTIGPMKVTIDEDGRTRVKDRYLVSAPLAGSMARIDLRPGDHVDKGTTLARILPLSPPLLDVRAKAGAQARLLATRAGQRQAQASAERGRVALDLAKSEATRAGELAKSGSISPAESDRVQAELRARNEELTSLMFGVKVADHEVDVARAALEHVAGSAPAGEQLQIQSPVSGSVLRVMQQSEGAVVPGAPLLEIGDPAHLEIAVDVLTADAVRVAPGAHATLERWGGDLPLRAHVRIVEPSAFPRVSALGVEEQRVNVILDLDEPESARGGLGDGYRVEARIVAWEGARVLKAPEGALLRHDGGWAVFAVRDERAVLAPVELGRRNGTEAQIVRGLAEGDAVIVHPSDRISDGARVRAR
jgi:HlyD family secretion protein